MSNLINDLNNLASMKESMVNKLVQLGDNNISTSDSMQKVVNHYDATRYTVLPTDYINPKNADVFNINAYVNALTNGSKWSAKVGEYCIPRCKIVYGWVAYSSSRPTINANFENAEMLIVGSGCSPNYLQFEADSFNMPKLKYIFVLNYAGGSEVILPGNASYSLNYPSVLNMPELEQIKGSSPCYSTEITGISSSSSYRYDYIDFIYYNSNIEKILLPKLSNTGVVVLAFNNMSKLKYINLSSWKGIFDSATNMCGIQIKSIFYSCSVLECVQLGDLDIINTDISYNCSAISTIVLHCTKVPSLSNYTNVAINDHFKSDGTGDGSIFVPDSLVNDFKVATNWSVFANYIKPMSQFVNTWES